MISTLILYVYFINVPQFSNFSDGNQMYGDNYMSILDFYHMTILYLNNK